MHPIKQVYSPQLSNGIQTLFQSSCLPPSSQKDVANCKSHSCQLPKPPFPYHIGKAAHWIGG